MPCAWPAGEQPGDSRAAGPGKAVRFSGSDAEQAAAPPPEPRTDAAAGEPVLKPEAGRLLAGLLHGLQEFLRPPARGAALLFDYEPWVLRA